MRDLYQTCVYNIVESTVLWILEMDNNIVPKHVQITDKLDKEENIPEDVIFRFSYLLSNQKKLEINVYDVYFEYLLKDQYDVVVNSLKYEGEKMNETIYV